MNTILARSGDRLLVVGPDWPEDPQALGVIIEPPTGEGWEVPVMSALVRGYWTESSGSIDISGYVIEPWPKDLE